MNAVAEICLVWDWNGTLWDDVDASVSALNGMLAARSLPAVSRRRYRERFRFPVRPFYAELGVRLECEDWDRLCVDYHRRYAAADGQRLRADAREALALAARAGCTQFALSALREDLLERDLVREGIRGAFAAVFGSDNLDGATKTDRGRALAAFIAARRPDPPPPIVTMIGDTLQDAETAAALGWRCVLVDGGHQAPERLHLPGLAVVPTLTAAVAAATKPADEIFLKYPIDRPE